MERAPESMDSETTGLAVGWHASALSALKVVE
jgi:hypothetical protein